MSRMWAAGAAMSACLALGVMSPLAQSPPPTGQDEAVAVVGTIAGWCDGTGGTEATEDGVHQVRDWSIRCREEMSDPRVSGLNEHSYDRDCRYAPSGGDDPVGCVEWSDFVLTGPDGSWEGFAREVTTAGDPGHWSRYRVATGTGAYAGWNYVSFADDMGVSGIIFEGPPPWEPPPALTQEAGPSPAPGTMPLATLHVDLRLAGLEGLALVGATDSRGAADTDLLEVVIDGPLYEGTAEVRLPPGFHALVLVADGTACDVSDGPSCGPIGEHGDRWCVVEFNLRRDDDLTIGISGIPGSDEGNHACQVSHLALQPLVLP